MNCKKDCKFLTGVDINITTADIIIVVESEASKIAYSPILNKIVSYLTNELQIANETIYITEMYKCPVGETKLTKTSLKKCLPILKKEIDALKPKYILSFGRAITSTLLGGTFNYLSTVYAPEYDSTVIPLYSPNVYSENPQTYEEHIVAICNTIKTEATIKKIPFKFLLETQEILNFIDSLYDKERLAFDVETTGLDMFAPNTKLLSIAFSSDAIGVSFPIDLLYNNMSLVNKDEIINKLKILFSNENILFIGHNIKFDMKVLEVLAGIPTPARFFDTMLAGYIIDENALSNRLEAWLSALNIENYKGYDFTESEYKEGNFSSMDKIASLLEYNAKDSAATLQLSEHLFSLLESEHIDTLITLTDLTKALIDVEIRGLRINTEILTSIKDTLENEMNEIHKKLWTYPEVIQAAEALNKPVEEINFDSPAQMVKIFEHGGYPIIERTPTNNISTGARVLKTLSEQYDIPFIKDLERYRKNSKILSGFILPYLNGTVVKADNRIHSEFNITGTVTGRLSSSNPNLQQIPRGDIVKQLFLPEEGHLMVNIDYSQAELRTMAALSKDPKLMYAYTNNIDVHALTASLVYNIPIEEVSKEQRQTAKMVNFAILYGSSAKGLALRLNKPEDEMTAFINKWYDVYSEVKIFIKQVTNYTLQNGYIRTPFYRFRHLPDIYSTNGATKAHAIRQANNFIIQSTASDITLRSIIRIFKFLNANPQYEARIVSTVHDSIVLSIKREQVASLLKELKTLVESYDYEWLQGIKMVADFSVGYNYAKQGDLEDLTDEAVEKALQSLNDEDDDFESEDTENEIDV